MAVEKLTTFPFAKVATSVAALVFLTLVLISIALPELQPFFAVLLVGILFLGIPHGALDIFLLQKLASSRSELVSLLLLYLIGLISMVAAWVLVPEGAFLLFVLFSCYHFAQSDLSESFETTSGVNRLRVEFTARFLIPFFIAFGFQPERSIELAKLIHPAQIFQHMVPVFQIAATAGIILSGLLIALELWNWIINKSAWRAVSLEPALLCVLFLLLDPLYAFGIYFCFVHSVKHLFNFMTSEIHIRLRDFLPFWLLPVIGILALALASRLDNASLETGLFKWSIIVISAMALPHTLLISLMKKRRILPH